MKFWHWLILAVLPILLIAGLFFAVISSEDDDDQPASNITAEAMNLSAEVYQHKSMVEKYCKEFGISEQVMVILAIMQVESGGKGGDVMQASESLGLPVNTLGTEASIKQGVKYFASLLKGAKAVGADLNTAIQSYNYGGGFTGYISKHGKKYTLELAKSFARDKSGDKKVTYTNPVAEDGWRYAYGNMYYVTLISQYLVIGGGKFDDKTVQAIMDEALKYQGTRYVFGGSTPTTGFDCSGLTSWCYGKAGIKLPRTAQAQYDAMAHLNIKDAKPGDLIFFHSTYNTADYVTHVGIYVGDMKMYHAGDPVGYGNLNTSYWQAHLIGAGRVKK